MELITSGLDQQLSIQRRIEEGYDESEILSDIINVKLTFLLNCVTFTVEINKLQYSQLSELGHLTGEEVILKILVGQKEEKLNLSIIGKNSILICNC